MTKRIYSAIRAGIDKSDCFVTAPGLCADRVESDGDGATAATRVVDPIRWFGLLVPRALRSAQHSFVTAVEESIPRTANAALRLNSLETEVEKLKKAIADRKVASGNPND